jgi:uncharacterized protein (DUF342 family)
MQISERVTLAEVDGQLQAQVRATAAPAPVEVGLLRGEFERSPYACWALNPQALELLAAKLGTEAAAFALTLGRREDAHYEIEVAPDASVAWLKIKAARGGSPASVDDALHALADAGVTFGIDAIRIRQACDAATDLQIEAARGVAPKPGEDTRFELLVVETRNRTPKVDAQGMVDFHELGDIPLVRPGQPLMRRHPPTAGEDGRDVRGAVLGARAGIDEGFDTKLGGSTLDGQDPNLLLAACIGQPVHVGNGVAVEQVLKMGAVDLTSGNIHYDGTVEIGADVSPGMTVQASGDVIIHGVVDGARIDAGGSVQVSGGIIARAEVHAGVAVSARFAENASIRAGTTIAIEQMALHCDLQALNQVLVGVAAGDRGRLVGGVTRATMLVRTPQLGASSGGVTRIQVGVNPVLAARRRELDQICAKQKADEDNLSKVLKHLTLRGDPKGLLPRAQASWKLALDAWSQTLAEIADLDQRLALTAHARIEVGGRVSGDVHVAIGQTLRQLRRSYGAGAFRVDEGGQLIFTDAGGSSIAVD